jgi:hypothetical protein
MLDQRTVVAFLTDAGKKIVRCGTGKGQGCGQMLAVLDSACCADGTCNITRNEMPDTCQSHPVTHTLSPLPAPFHDG